MLCQVPAERLVVLSFSVYRPEHLSLHETAYVMLFSLSAGVLYLKENTVSCVWLEYLRLL